MPSTITRTNTASTALDKPLETVSTTIKKKSPKDTLKAKFRKTKSSVKKNLSKLTRAPFAGPILGKHPHAVDLKTYKQIKIAIEIDPCIEPKKILLEIFKSKPTAKKIKEIALASKEASLTIEYTTHFPHLCRLGSPSEINETIEAA